MMRSKYCLPGARSSIRTAFCVSALVVLQLATPPGACARDVEAGPNTGEITVYVTPREPTQVQFPSTIGGGYKNSNSALSLDKQDRELIIFSSNSIPPEGEAFLVRLKDGRSYSLRVKRADSEHSRDPQVTILDSRGSIIEGDPDELLPYEEPDYEYAPPSQVSGLIREMVLVAEFGKSTIPGYKYSEKYRGQTVLNDGTLEAHIESIFIGPTLWGYVLKARNLLDQSQKLNPATFRLDGTRAISLENWELAPRPLTVEEQIAEKDSTKIYIVTRARN